LVKPGCSLDDRLVPKDGLPLDSGNLPIVMGGPMSVNDPHPAILRQARDAL
jgi:GMP synthase-like glutamine amidotransferase